MKTVVYFSILLFLLISCTLSNLPSNYSNNFYDEYKDKNTSILKQELYPKEFNSNIQNIEIEMVRYDDTLENEVQIFINIVRNKVSQPIENQLYIKSNEEQIFKIPLMLINAKNHETKIVETNTVQKIDTSGNSSTQESTSNKVISWNTDSYKAILPNEIARELEKSYSLSWRLYSGATPSTFVLKNKNMEKFNCFINQESNQ